MKIEVNGKQLFWLIITVVCILGVIQGMRVIHNEVEKDSLIVTTDTVYDHRVDTVEITHVKTIYKPKPTKIDTVIITTDTNETVQHIQKTYEHDSLYEDTTRLPSVRIGYHLYVHTNDYDVDSMGVRFKVNYPIITDTKTITKEITKYKRQHFGYGFQIGGGYGVFNRKPDLYVGFGVQYNF